MTNIVHNLLRVQIKFKPTKYVDIIFLSDIITLCSCDFLIIAARSSKVNVKFIIFTFTLDNSYV